MGIIVVIVGVLVLGYAVFGTIQPRYNKPQIFRTAGGTMVVYVVGLIVLVAGLYLI